MRSVDSNVFSGMAVRFDYYLGRRSKCKVSQRVWNSLLLQDQSIQIEVQYFPEIQVYHNAFEINELWNLQRKPVIGGDSCI